MMRRLGNVLWKASPFYAIIEAWKVIVDAFKSEPRSNRPRTDLVRDGRRHGNLVWDAEYDMWFEDHPHTDRHYSDGGEPKKVKEKRTLTPHKFI